MVNLGEVSRAFSDGAWGPLGNLGRHFRIRGVQLRHHRLFFSRYDDFINP
jgi:hypothetical protein